MNRTDRPADKSEDATSRTHWRGAMNGTENVTERPGESECALRDEELEAVNGGIMVALGGPDTRPQSDHTCWIRVSSPYAGAGAGSV